MAQYAQYAAVSLTLIITHANQLPISCIIVSFSYIYISQGSVATLLGCGRIFTNSLIANFLESVPVTKFRKSLNIWQRYGQYQVGLF